MDSPWHSCWWIYEKEQRLGQQSLGWALSHIYCANWKAGQTVGHNDAEPLLPLCGSEICRARFLAAYRACFSTSEGELCVRQGWEYLCITRVLLCAAGLSCPQLRGCRNRGRVSSWLQSERLQSWLRLVFWCSAQLLSCLISTEKWPIYAAVFISSLRKSL